MVMPFRLTNTPAIFQAYINKVLIGLLDITTVTYIDNIIIFSNLYKEYIKHVW